MPSINEFDRLDAPTAGIGPRSIILRNADLLYPKLSPVTGHQINLVTGLSVLANVEATADVPANYLDMSSMKGLHWIMRAGILRGDLVYIRQWLLGAEAILSYRNQVTPDIGTWIIDTGAGILPDGSFPAESGGRSKKNYSLHHKIIVLDRLAQGVEQFVESPYYTGDEAVRAAAIVAMLDVFGTFLLTFNDHADAFIDSAGAGNQTLSIVSFLQALGNLTGNTAYSDKARAIVEWIRDDPTLVARLIFPTPTTAFMQEKKSADGIGFDGSYDSLSLELMSHYCLGLPAGSWKDYILTVCQAMIEHLMLTVDVNPASPTYGEVFDEAPAAWSTWTRVHETVPIVRVPNSIDYDFCSFAFHIRMGAYVTATHEEMSDAIMGVGQRFGHLGDDPDATDPVEDIIRNGGLSAALKQLLLAPSRGRQFTISPGVSGRTRWNLDRDGPCAPPPGTYTIVPRKGFAGSVELWGPSSGSGGVGATTIVNPTTASATTFTTEGAPMSAGAGGQSQSKTSNSVGAGGPPGIASGGDVNTPGSPGTNGVTGTISVAGNGGNAPPPKGGTGATGASAAAGETTPGSQGTAPGGGASGAVHGNATNASRRAAGGSGSGAYCQRTFAKGALPSGIARALIVSAGTAAGTGDLANGAPGKDGSAVIT